MGKEIPPLIRFPIRVDDPIKRNKVLTESEQAGLGVMPSYPDSIVSLRQAGLDCEGAESRGGGSTRDQFGHSAGSPLNVSR